MSVRPATEPALISLISAISNLDFVPPHTSSRADLKKSSAITETELHTARPSIAGPCRTSMKRSCWSPQMPVERGAPDSEDLGDLGLAHTVVTHQFCLLDLFRCHLRGAATDAAASPGGD